MNQKHMKLGTISEDYRYSICTFSEVDDRCYLYSTNDYIPCSSGEPIAWQDADLSNITSVPDVIEHGDKIVTKDIAQLIMSFDPYGVEVYPARLIINEKVVNDRYIISVKNIIDAIDMERSHLEEGERENSPPIVFHLAINPDKLNSYPLNKRLVFKVEGSNATFFDGSIIDKFVENLLDGKYRLCQVVPFDTSLNKTPTR